MDFNRYFSFVKRQRSREMRDDEDESIKSYLPLLATPINKDAREALSSHANDPEKIIVATSGAASLATTMLAGNGRTSSGNIVIYKPHHEATSIELFYDLFFVANLGTIISCIAERHAYFPQPTLQRCINTLMQSVSFFSLCISSH